MKSLVEDKKMVGDEIVECQRFEVWQTTETCCGRSLALAAHVDREFRKEKEALECDRKHTIAF